MESLPESLSALNQFDQFIVWAYEDENKNEKPRKVPVSWIDGSYIAIHDTAGLTTSQNAIESAKRLGDKYGVGFVLTANDDLWCIDVDDCINDQGEYNETALELYGRFSGCAFEVSHSGKGIHLFGRGPVPEHKKKYKPKKIEFYTQDRFIALTGYSATGDVNYRNDPAINQLVIDYFLPDVTSDIVWSNQPHPHWRGPDDDDELIKQMLKSRSFSLCNIKDLWKANTTALERAYPAIGTGEYTFDHSSADAALCLALAWWTGGNCERIKRIFEKSALVRKKWLTRPDYQKETIESAVRKCVGCLGQDQAIKEQNRITWSEPHNEQITDCKITMLGGARVVAFQNRPDFFQNHFYLTRINRVYCPDGVTRIAGDYNSRYAGYEFLEHTGGTKPIKEPWKAYVTATNVERMDVFDTVYRPESKFLSILTLNKKRYVNTYEDCEVASIPGDPTIFINHIKKLLPNEQDAEKLICYLASFIQNPGVKFKWAPFIQGVEGCGKSLITQLLVKIIGTDHVHYLNPDDFVNTGGKFNGYLAENRLIIIEEISMKEQRSMDGPLKRFIDHPMIEIQRKGLDQITVQICANFILNSNFQDALPIDENSRRYCPFFCAQQTKEDLERDGMDEYYFTAIFDWLNGDGIGIMANYLREYKIPYELNPATGAQRAPLTSSFTTAVGQSRNSLETAIHTALKSGENGTRNGWVSVNMLTKMIEEENVIIRSVTAIGKTLTKLGYITHPALDSNAGRTNQGISQEGGKRAKLYLKRGHDALKTCRTGVEVGNAYLISQGYTTANFGVVR